jgi:predicted DNA-binding protein (MmcQ/YjbR family)
MDAETARNFLVTLPDVVETQQWGDNLVFWVGDKAIGGKMFCLINLSAGDHGAVSYSAGPERFAELVERDALKPAPYFARIHWIAAERWQAFRNTEWHDELRAARDITYDKLPKKVKDTLALPRTAREKLTRERRKLLAARAKANKNEK